MIPVDGLQEVDLEVVDELLRRQLDAHTAEPACQVCVDRGNETAHARATLGCVVVRVDPHNHHVFLEGATTTTSHYRQHS